MRRSGSASHVSCDHRSELSDLFIILACSIRVVLSSTGSVRLRLLVPPLDLDHLTFIDHTIAAELHDFAARSGAGQLQCRHLRARCCKQSGNALQSHAGFRLDASPRKRIMKLPPRRANRKSDAPAAEMGSAASSGAICNISRVYCAGESRSAAWLSSEQPQAVAERQRTR
jgi:hypothetical protein